MVSRPSGAIFLHLAAGYDLAHCLQLCDHYFEVQTNMNDTYFLNHAAVY